MQDASASSLLSVVVKCLNEEANLERCLRSLDAEVFGVTIVQLADPADRRCGAAGHLGWQFVRGRFLLLIDGDMELLPGFLPAGLAALEADGRLGAVGGGLIETSDAIEYRERQSRPDPGRRPGEVDHLTGCALYRVAALRDAGHFTDRNLHCFEEFELGLRLRAKGWRLRRLDVACVRHHGHRDASIALLIRRWRTRFLWGYGELLRAAWGRAYFREALKPCRFAIVTLLWWGALLALAAAAVADARHAPGLLALLVVVAALPFAVALARKRSLERAAYAWLMQQFSAAALLAGLFAARVAPATPLAANVLQDPRPGRAGAASAPSASAPSAPTPPASGAPPPGGARDAGAADPGAGDRGAADRGATDRGARLA